jgi:hypothetical protein
MKELAPPSQGERLMKPTARLLLLVALLLAVVPFTSSADGEVVIEESGTCSVQCSNGRTGSWQVSSGTACFDVCFFACGIAGQGVYTCQFTH